MTKDITIWGGIFLVISVWFNYHQHDTYKDKLVAQQYEFVQKQKEIKDKFDEELKKQEAKVKDSEELYAKSLKDLERAYKTNEALDADYKRIIDGMRSDQDRMRTRIMELSDQTLREYALAASEAFRELSEALGAEQQAHRETSTKAEQYYLAWKALDTAWPVKEQYER